MLKEWWQKVTDPRIIITKGSEELRRKTCPECGQVAKGRYDYNNYGFFITRYYDIYKCYKCDTTWRVPQQ